MAIIQEEVTEISGGFLKEIDAGAKHMMFDILQKHQYGSPIKSTVREIVSNGLDSTREKEVAISILSGSSTINDHFEYHEGELYKDSKFEADYYDINYFSENNWVEIIYVDGGEMGKDKIIFRDFGVGLGGKRLEGYFSLGFSTKRLNRFALGKFGIGNKSPLSTGAQFYTVVSYYNGKEFSFNVYDHKVESIVPQFDLDDLTENPSWTFSNGYKCHFRRTDHKNGLQIELQVKKHHKQQYIDAVIGQLLYFPNVRMYVQDPEGNRQEIPVRAEILYEDDLIVLSKNSPYSKPHLLLNGVNYGYINFEELELESKLGNIGIKVSPEKVSVNPSRESLIWDDVTRQVVMDKFNEVVGIAETTINKGLKETDFLKWLRLCAQASGANTWFNDSSKDTIIGRLASIVDMSKIELAYPLNSKIKFNSSTLDGLKVNLVTLKILREGSKIIKTVEYAPKWKSAVTEGIPILLQKGETSNRKNKYLLTHLYSRGFVCIRLDAFHEDGRSVTGEDIPVSTRVEGLINEKRKISLAVAKDMIADLHNYILASSDKMWYENIQVPEDFVASEEEEEEETEEKTEEARQSAADRRKLEGKTVIHTPRIIHYLPDNPKRVYEMQKIEVPVHLVDAWSNREVYWSNQDYEPLLHTASLISRPYSPLTSFAEWTSGMDLEFENWKLKGYSEIENHEYRRSPWFHDQSLIRLIKVAQQNVKFYRDFKHITRFFKEIKEKIITMSTTLVRWNTARLIQEKFEDLNFLKGFASLNMEKASAFQILSQYVDDYWRPFEVETAIGADDETTNQIISHLEKVGQFQLFVRQNPDDTAAITQLAKELFNPQPGVKIEDGRAIDIEIYDLFLNLLDWAQPVKALMNMVSPLVDAESLTDEQEEAIRNYFKYRDCPI